MGLNLSHKESYSKIIGVYLGSNIEKIVVVINNTLENDVVYLWNMNHNVELDSLDVGKKYEIIFNSNGDVIIATDNSCIYKGTYIKAF